MNRQTAQKHAVVIVLLAALGCLCWPSIGLAQPDGQGPDKRWRAAAPMPLGVFHAAGSKLGDGRYVVTGGLWQSGLAGDAVQVYDQPADVWSVPAHLKVPRYSHAHVPLDGHTLLVVGGRKSTEVARGVAVFAPELIDLKAGESHEIDAPPDAQPTRGPTAQLVDGVAWVIGGRFAHRYDAGRRAWLAPVPLNESRDFHVSLLLPDGRLLVIGGSMRDTIEIIDTRRLTSVLLPVKFPTALEDFQAHMTEDGRVWVLGGQDSRTGDTTNRTWFLTLGDEPVLTEGPRLMVKAGVADHQIAEVPPWLFVIGGESQVAGKDTELSFVHRLDLRTTKVGRAPSLPQPADDALAAAFGQRVYVFGGFRLRPSTFGGVRIPVAENAVFWIEAPLP